MWVTAGKFYGTLGGGTFERKVLEEARERLDKKADAELREFSLSRELDQCCGGRVQVFFETLQRRKTVHLMGGGHVGKALAETLAGMPLDIRVIDAREEWSRPEALPDMVDVLREDPAAYAERFEWTKEDAACILTHSHELDFSITKHLLTTPVGYLGLIGSGHKATVFRARLGELAEVWDERMHCPIGHQLDSKNPKIIAVSIASELLETWGLRAADKTRIPARGRSR